MSSVDLMEIFSFLFLQQGVYVVNTQHMFIYWFLKHFMGNTSQHCVLTVHITVHCILTSSRAGTTPNRVWDIIGNKILSCVWRFKKCLDGLVVNLQVTAPSGYSTLSLSWITICKWSTHCIYGKWWCRLQWSSIIYRNHSTYGTFCEGEYFCITDYILQMFLYKTKYNSTIYRVGYNVQKKKKMNNVDLYKVFINLKCSDSWNNARVLWWEISFLDFANDHDHYATLIRFFFT